jgi:hypothetical protein
MRELLRLNEWKVPVSFERERRAPAQCAAHQQPGRAQEARRLVAGGVHRKRRLGQVRRGSACGATGFHRKDLRGCAGQSIADKAWAQARPAGTASARARPQPVFPRSAAPSIGLPRSRPPCSRHTASSDPRRSHPRRSHPRGGCPCGSHPGSGTQAASTPGKRPLRPLPPTASSGSRACPRHARRCTPGAPPVCRAGAAAAAALAHRSAAGGRWCRSPGGSGRAR